MVWQYLVMKILLQLFSDDEIFSDHISPFEVIYLVPLIVSNTAGPGRTEEMALLHKPFQYTHACLVQWPIGWQRPQGQPLLSLEEVAVDHLYPYYLSTQAHLVLASGLFRIYHAVLLRCLGVVHPKDKMGLRVGQYILYSRFLSCIFSVQY